MLVEIFNHVVAVAAVSPGSTLLVKSGQRTMSLSFKDLDEYVGARASRGGLLPRGWQKVDGYPKTRLASSGFSLWDKNDDENERR